MIQFRLQDDKRALQFVADALDWLAAFEAKFSRFKADSLVSKINQELDKALSELERLRRELEESQ
jgi:thiamine biosynthesis lipoprotein